MLPRRCREHAGLVGLDVDLNAGITNPGPFAWAYRVLAEAPERSSCSGRSVTFWPKADGQEGGLAPIINSPLITR